MKLHLWRGIRGVIYAAIGIAIGAIIATTVFVTARREASAEQILSRVSDQTLTAVRLRGASDPPAKIDRILAFSLDVAKSPTMVVTGSYRLSKARENTGSGRIDKFLAVSEQLAPTDVEQALAQEPDYAVQTVFYFGGFDEKALVPERIRADDLDGDGQQELLFDITSRSESGSSISPVILKRRGENWYPIVMPNLEDAATPLYYQSVVDGRIEYDRELFKVNYDEYTRNMRKTPLSFRRMNDIEFGKERLPLFDLRRSGVYQLRCQPDDGHVQLVVSAAYEDGPALGPHRIFSAVYRLDDYKWVPDKSWNNGQPTISMEKRQLVSSEDLATFYDAALGTKQSGLALTYGDRYGVESRSAGRCAP